MSSARLFAFAPHERGPSDFPRADVTDDVRWLLDMVRDLSYDDGIGGIPDEIEARIEAWMVLLDYPREQWPSEKREAQRQAVAAANRARRENLRKAAEEAARRARMWRDLTVEEQADLLLRASSADVDLPRLVDRDPEITLREFLPPIEAREREVAAGLRLRSFRDELADAEAEAAWYGRGLDSDTEDLP